MKLTINKIPDNFIGSLPITLVTDQNKMEYEVRDDFIRDLKFYWAGMERDNFTTLLIRLLFKADHENIFKLSKGYAAECLTICMCKADPKFHEQMFEKDQ